MAAMTAPAPTTTEREALAAFLFFICEVTGQGDPTWPEMVATYGDDHPTVVKYRDAAYALAAHDADLVQRTREQVAQDLERERERFQEAKDGNKPSTPLWHYYDGKVDGFEVGKRIAREGGAR